MEELQSELTGKSGAVVMFTQPRTCAPCRQFRPHYERAAEQSDLNFLYVDLDVVPNAMVEYRLMKVPTVYLFRNGQYLTELQNRTAVSLLNEIKFNIDQT